MGEVGSLWLFVVSCHDGAIVKFYKWTGKIQSDSCADIAVVGIGRTLIETLEYGFYFIFWYAYTIVFYRNIGMVFGMCKSDDNMTSGGCKLESIRQYIHDYFVEIVAVNPYWECFRVVFKLEGDVFVGGLL